MAEAAVAQAAVSPAPGPLVSGRPATAPASAAPGRDGGSASGRRPERSPEMRLQETSSRCDG
eukprot:2192675-Pyramimonas_sp.AAC.1